MGGSASTPVKITSSTEVECHHPHSIAIASYLSATRLPRHSTWGTRAYHHRSAVLVYRTSDQGS